MKPSLARRLLRSLYGSMVAYDSISAGRGPRARTAPRPSPPRGPTSPAGRARPERTRAHGPGPR
ncbi:hypothetical protein ACFWUZ_34715 [Streptomyces sp. NPDC058646]|uniref:hypothetical protein n=1 Tax=Streptomyces sp. NPDC058646 TaxID=3346574 RepID=UPI0036549A6D